jgi:diguanylate cyclase (GGDEF)-like protein
MKFPLINELVTTNVTQVKIDDTLNDAIHLMHQENHRNVIVNDKNRFFIVTASDLLKLKLKGHDFSKPLSTIRLTELPIINKNENILETIEFLEQSIEYVCTINEDCSLYGILTHTDIISNMDPETLMDNYRLCDLINMSKPIHKVSKDIKTSLVLKEMADGDFDSVIVIENNKPVGIITTKDIMNLLKTTADLELEVGEYMTSPIETLNEHSTIKDAIAFMKRKHFKRIVVTDENEEIIALILQRELISLSYNKWAMLMKEYSDELSQINDLLEKKSKKYEQMASTDQLTGLYNRYKFTEVFISAYQTMVQRDNDLSLIIIDIDHFKKINDTYGHNVGDSVLVTVADILIDHLRNVDVICRWGGEEFAILLPTASVQNATTLAEKIRIAISQYNMGNDFNVTASFGITKVNQGDKLESVIKRADDALYEAKNLGRNQTQVKL